MQAQEQWSEEWSCLQSEQERVTGERDRALAECDQLMAQSATTSSELSRLKMELLSQQQALQVESDKVRVAVVLSVC